MDIKSFHLYDRLSKAAMAMPNVHEQLCYGTPAFYVEKKFFVRLKEDSETTAIYCMDREECMAKNGDTFFITDHYKNYPMLLVDLNMVSDEDLQTLIRQAWEIRAPKRLLKQYSGDLNTPH